MKIWQSLMIRLATSSRLKHLMQSNRSTTRLARRFVGGDNIDDALKTISGLNEKGFSVSGYYLGEYVDNRELVDLNVDEISQGIERIGASDFQLHYSIDPTQVGFGFDDDLGDLNARNIGEQFKKLSAGNNRAVLMLDMEDHSYVERTLMLRDSLDDAGVPVAQTLQAYLRRTESDLKKLIDKGAMVRLVKGAFVGTEENAFATNREIDANYRKLIDIMLSKEAKEAGFYPVFGTHDADMALEVERLVSERHWDIDAYEFEMLYGVRPELQQDLVRRGHRVRLYLPYGVDWWPYAVRRVGESPRNAKLLLRASVSR